MKNIFIAIATVALFSMGLSGCTSVGKLLTTGMVDKSNYFPGIIASESDIDDYMKVVKPVSGQVVSDELGTFYHVVADNKIFSMLLRRDDGAALKNMFSSSQGLMEPEYTFNSNGELALDWALTTERHSFLVNEMKLKVLPLSETRKYHELIGMFAAQRAASNRGAMGVMSEAFKGQNGLYNDKYSMEVLDKVAANYGYIITTSSAPVYFNGKMFNQPFGIASMRSFLKSTKGQSFRFVTKNFYSDANKGGLWRFSSGCYFFDAIAAKAEVNFGISQAMAASKNPAGERAAFINDLEDFKRSRVENDRNCKSAFQAMQVAGAVQSERLK